MTIADTPSGQAHFNVIHLGFVVTIAVGYEEEVGRSAEPEPVETHRDTGGKGDLFGEDGALVCNAITVRVLKDQDAAVTGVGKASLAGFVVAVFSDPKAAVIVPAKGHRLRDHRFAGIEVRLETILGGHRLQGILGCEELGLAGVFLVKPPQGAHVARVAGVFCPALGHVGLVHFLGVNDQPVAHGLNLAFLELPVT